MASSSESSDEDLEKFAAIAGIVDTEVSKKSNSESSHGSSKPHTKPGLRGNKERTPDCRHRWEDEEVPCSASDVITPEFRQHVAKKLSKFLDSSYICTQEVEQNGHHNNNSHKSSGIKLLLTSSQRLQDEPVKQISTVIKSKNNKKNCSSSSESDTDEEELNRLAEAAVSGHSIIKNVSTVNQERTETGDETTENSSVKIKKERKRKKKKQRLDVEAQHKKKHKKRKEDKLKEET